MFNNIVNARNFDYFGAMRPSKQSKVLPSGCTVNIFPSSPRTRKNPYSSIPNILAFCDTPDAVVMVTS